MNRQSHWRSVSVLSVVLVCLIGCEMGHADVNRDAAFAVLVDVSSEDESASTVRSHPFGTLLVDSDDRYWVVTFASKRSEVPLAEQGRLWFDRSSAIQISDEEVECLQIDERPWQFRDPAWRLVRVAGELLYVHDALRLRRRANAIVIRAWHDNAETAPDRSSDRDAIQTYLYVGMMPLPAGTLVRSETRLYFFERGRLLSFRDEDLARQAGYHVDRAVSVSEADLGRVGRVSGRFTQRSFSTCSSHDDADPTEDSDGDGVPSARDCNDYSFLRAPGIEEICDGMDNDCDGAIDEGFAIGEQCVDPSDRSSPAGTVCHESGRSVVCRQYGEGDL